jgi:hypothetical protein
MRGGLFLAAEAGDWDRAGAGVIATDPRIEKRTRERLERGRDMGFAILFRLYIKSIPEAALQAKWLQPMGVDRFEPVVRPDHSIAANISGPRSCLG